MADRWAVATGNWSSTATWNGGTLPTSSDDVFADGFTVTIDQDITVLSIRTTQRIGGTAGGGFTVSGTRTINANVTAGTTACLTISTSSSNITVNGNLTGGSASNADAISYSASSSTLTITGSLTGGTNSSARALYMNAFTTSSWSCAGNAVNGTSGPAIRVQSSAPGTLNGNATSSSSVSTISVATGTITINGNCSGNNCLSISNGTVTVASTSNLTGDGSTGVISFNNGRLILSCPAIVGGSSISRPGLVVSGGTASVTANITAGASNAVTVSGGVLYAIGNVQGTTTQDAITCSNASNVVVVGNVTGGTTGDGISSSSTGSFIIVHGTVTGGSSSGGHGISNSGRPDIRIFGTEVSGAGGAAVNNTGTGTKTTTAVGGGGGSVRFVNTRGGADQ